jgi:AraC-like DNA-binding protein
MWNGALRDFGRPGLPTALASAIPFGAFGVLDYLAGSAETLGACCESLAFHFDIVANDVRLALELSGSSRWLHVHADNHLTTHATEFTVAMVVVRLRHLVPGFSPQQVFLTSPAPLIDTLHQQTFSCPVVYGAPVAGLSIAATDWRMPTQQADPYLHKTLKGLAAQMKLGRPDASELEQAVRARLRDALPSGDASPGKLARLIGLSERTLQRRLADVGRSFSEVVEDFRHEEALRLMSDSKLALVQIAATLGFSQQSSFTRAFKRWTSKTPGAWRVKQRARK